MAPLAETLDGLAQLLIVPSGAMVGVPVERPSQTATACSLVTRTPCRTSPPPRSTRGWPSGPSALLWFSPRLIYPDPLEAVMAGARIYDGLVSAEEIVREWDLNADLVTLSACETGLGKVVTGEGYVGLAHAFLQAGARSLLVSLWKVEDTATSLLMRRFHENRLGNCEDERNGRVAEPMSKANALQEAKRCIRSCADEHGERPYDHPYYWSAFVLIGDRG